MLTLLFGLNCFRNIVVFGFAVSDDQNKETMYRILRSYFLFHNKIFTETIFTFETKELQTGGVRSALTELI